MRFQTKLQLVMSFLIVATIATMSVMLLNEAHQRILARNQGHGERVVRMASRLIRMNTQQPARQPRDQAGSREPGAYKAALEQLLQNALQGPGVARAGIIDPSGSVVAGAARGRVPFEADFPDELRELCVEFLDSPEAEAVGFHRFRDDAVTLGRIAIAGEGPDHVLILQEDEGRVIEMLRGAAFSILSSGIPLIAIGLAASWWLSRSLSRPLKAVSSGVSRYADGDFTHRVVGGRAFPAEVRSLVTSFNRMADSVEAYIHDLEAETRLRERLESELRIAAELQQQMLPLDSPVMPAIELRGWSKPAREVGGDFYDYVELDSNLIGVAIGDATGKGLPAALLITECWSAFKALLTLTGSPAELMGRINKSLWMRTHASRKFVTLFFALVDSGKGTMRCASAGHNPPILIRRGRQNQADGGINELEGMGGFPLGIAKECQYMEIEIALDPGDTLIMYSDGLTDAVNEQSERYGTGRLRGIIEKHQGEGADRLLEVIRQDVASHIGGAGLFDDITVAVVQYIPALTTANA